MPIIKSLLDTDQYKLTMQNAILSYKQGVPVKYRFINRRPEMRFNMSFANALREEIKAMAKLHATDDEIEFLKQNCPYLGHQYLEYLRNYRFDPKEVKFCLTPNGELDLSITGTWERTILWEVPLMAAISEFYFLHCDTNWTFDEIFQIQQLKEKAEILKGSHYLDFGTRRRRNYATQSLVVSTLKQFPEFMGTSNVHLAHINGVKPRGTMAHEWIQAISALEGLRHANRYALRIWNQVYKGNLGYALTDTFGTPAFFEDFDGELARMYDGMRQDSECPYTFGENAIKHYESLSIDPKTKAILFSDSLTARGGADVNKAFAERVKVTLCIGTHLTNDFRKKSSVEVSLPLNMVIKMVRCNGSPVVKLSDSPTKAIGDKDALRVARWTFFGTPLDSQ